MEWLLWTDIETTGIDVNNSKILQIACVLTNFDLSIIYHIPEITVGCDLYTLNNMDSWCIEHHNKSGLFKKASQSEITLSEAEERILYILNQYIGLNDTVYMAGNSVHFDKRFIDHYMSKLSKILSHRLVDVTSFSLVYRHICPLMHNKRPEKEFNHTAQKDIYESINEYKYYLNFIKTLDRN